MAIAANLGYEPDEGRLPIIVKLPTIVPGREESWDAYRHRVARELDPVRGLIGETMRGEAIPLVLANALATTLAPEQAVALAERREIARVELNPRVQLAQMDDVGEDIHLPDYRARHPQLDGSGVRVAVLDSGIDTQHPFLKVLESAQTCGESTDIPGRHGTHCAGIIASRDSSIGGVAPGADLLNIKVLSADGRGTHTDIARGLDAALERDADVLSMSLGFNHLPTWFDGGHGWQCANGHCPLCTAVDNAIALKASLLVVVAAGNEHQRAEALRRYGYGGSFDAELGCPGQARGAVTVGALTKRTFHPATFSSHGPTSYGTTKPDLSAPGVNIISTVPVPRDSQGRPIGHPGRSDLFARMSGTSMATPIVAGAVALIVQSYKASGRGWTAQDVKNTLLKQGISALPGHGINVVGAGLLDLAGL